MKEDKALVTKKLLEAVKVTRNGEEISDMVYVGDQKQFGKEYVDVYYSTGYIKRINVAMDSGTALIRDVMRELD